MAPQTPDSSIHDANPFPRDALGEHFERCPVGMFLLDGERRFLASNPGFARVTGMKLAIIAGSTLRRFLTTDATGALEHEVFQAVDRDGHWAGEVEFRSSIGETSPMLLSITLVGDGSEDTARYVGTVAELGERRWLESESERRARDLAAFSAIAVATGSSADPQEMLSTAARQVVDGMDVDACWIHRYDAAESRVTLVGEASYLDPSVRLPAQLVPTALNPSVLWALQTRELVQEREDVERGNARVLHLPLLARGDAVGVLSILSIAGETLSDHDADLLRALSYQIGTALQNVRLVESVREHEAELQEKNEQLQRLVERLQAADRMKSEFLANTSHELRTPLNSIIGFLDLILAGLVTDESERIELLRHAGRSSRQLLDLINDVLDLSRIEAGRVDLEFEEVLLAEVIAGVETTMQVQARQKELTLGVGPISADLRVLADAARARQVLLNVVGNAIKFTQHGGVTIRVDEAPGSPFVDVTVRDTGVGIPVGRRDFLFKKFSQADASTTRKFGGTGLGLAIVKDLIEAMGGAVRVDSSGENQGTSVTLTFARSGATCEARVPDVWAGGATAEAGGGAPEGADAGGAPVLPEGRI
jgi:PAS domain S-box-containing protein